MDQLAISPDLLANVPEARSKSGDPAKIRDAAEQFEALLLGQLLESAHPKGGWLGGGDEGADGTAISFGEQQLAATMAHHGGIGLAKLVMQGLERK
jgi:flagellar protein FlgJ